MRIQITKSEKENIKNLFEWIILNLIYNGGIFPKSNNFSSQTETKELIEFAIQTDDLQELDNFSSDRNLN